MEAHCDIEDDEASAATGSCWPYVGNSRTVLVFEDHATSATKNLKLTAAADCTVSGAAVSAMAKNARLACMAAAERMLCMAAAAKRYVFVSKGSTAGRSQSGVYVDLVDSSVVGMVMHPEAQRSNILLLPFRVCY